MQIVDNESIIEFCGGVRARRREGSGPAILWVHGYTIDSTSWSDLWDLLPGNAHVGIDMPGHGLSSPLPFGQTLRGLGEQLAEAALTHGLRHVVGLSLGSMVALAIATAQPDAFLSLCLGAPAIGGGPADPDVGVKYRNMARLFLAKGPGEAMRDLWMASPPDLFRYAEDKPALWTRLAASIARYRWDEFSGPGVARLAIEPQPLKLISAVRTPTLIFIGEYEFAAFRETAALLGSHMPHCAVIELGGVGHLCLLEAPDRTAHALKAHFSRAEGLRRIDAGRDGDHRKIE